MPETRLGVVWRALLAAVVVVGCAAGTTATAGLLQVKNIANGFKAGGTVNTGGSKAVKLPAPGEPETLLLVGVDCRPGTCGSRGAGNTDTMILVRINDSSSTINLLSIPRDLYVDIPGHGYDKLNAAYSEGESRLLLQTLRADVFPGLVVTHIMIVDFSGFAKLINEIGCVYTDVDHRYYNYNDGTTATDFSNIDIEPGYQKLCGGSGSNLGGANTALAFVRFRHNDSDFVRQARQQDFLRWAKEDYSTGQLAANASTLFDTFSHNVQTDKSLHSVDGIDDLIRLALNANGSTLKSIPFNYIGYVTLPGVGNVVRFEESASEQAYQKLMTPTTAPEQSTTTTSTPPPRKRKGTHRRRSGVLKLPAGMTSDPADGRSQAAQVGRLSLPVYYPRYLPDDYEYCFAVTGNCSEGYDASVYAKSYPRSYDIQGDDGKHYPSYVFTLVNGNPGQPGNLGTGEYFTVQGTTWMDPPILRDPSRVTNVGGKRLYEYSQGGALADVAWKTKRGVYWVSNTLQNTIPNNEMVAMAASSVAAPR